MEYLDIMYDLLPGKINWTNNNLMDMIHEIRVQKLATGKKWETNAVSNFFLLCEMHFCDVFAHDKTMTFIVLSTNPILFIYISRVWSERNLYNSWFPDQS